jgi:hypothetical protein
MRSEALRDPGVKRRALLFAAALVFFNVGPAFTWATGIRVVPFWQMYNAYGQRICRVELHELRDDGTRAPVDRFAALGTTRTDARRRVRRVEDEDDARWLARRLCRGPLRGRDLRMSVDCGHADGWRHLDVFDDVNACALPAKERAR